MSLYYKTEGFVFKKDDSLEADRNFSVFTKDFGRVEIFAKAIRKINAKLKGGIDIFHFSEIEFVQGKKRKTLTDAVLLDKFSGIAGHPENFLLALKISELMDNFIKGQ